MCDERGYHNRKRAKRRKQHCDGEGGRSDEAQPR